MEESRRVRLFFKDKEAILNQSQKSQGFKRCWVLLKPQHRTIADLSAYILNVFGLSPSCPQGLILCVDGFVLPPFESTGILKDKDIISVRKNPLTLCLEGSNAANTVEELQIMDKQPVNSGALLLANEEFEKETGGYQSEEPKDELKEEDQVDEFIDETEEDDEEEQLEDSFHPEKSSGVDATTKKRKAPEKLHGTKKKKQRLEVQESIQNDVSANQVGNSHHETPDKLRNLSNVKKKKEGGGGDKKNVDLNGTDMDTQPNLKETDQIKNGDKASEGTRKGPSRSARRKKAKRRWIREMAKIQKQADASQPKGLQNWKQKPAPAPARAGKKKLNNWKQKPVQVYSSKEDCGEPKGLLHWKSWSTKDKSDDKKDDKDVHQNGSTSEQPNQNNNMEDEIVPVVIKPGHIRFEPLEGDQVQWQSQASGESLQWNGITSKRKGQKWGTEKLSYSQRNGNKDVVGVQSHTLSTSKETNMNHPIDFDKLPSLSELPKEGDVIGYRILELSSSWSPELSSYRVGQVSSCNPQSGKVLLLPVEEHPIVPERPDEGISDQQPDNFLYKEDGSLEIDFSTLVDVRIVKDGIGGRPREAETDGANRGPTPMENAILLETPTSKDKQTQASTAENGRQNHSDQENATGTGNGSDLWEQISEALSAKKAQLSQGSSWGKPKPATGSWSYRTLKGSAMGPTMALLRSKNKSRNS